jgi:alpha-methylacyl-CoA racemase
VPPLNLVADFGGGTMFLVVGILAALEPKFFAELVAILGLDDVPAQQDRGAWSRMREMFTRAFLSRTRDEWAGTFEGVDGCVAPVLDLAEAPDGAHLAARGTFTVGAARPGSGQPEGVERLGVR